MRAVRLERHGDPGVLGVQNIPEPVPGPGDALVEVRASGLNHLDIWVRQGGARKFPLPIVLGTDAAGVVLEAPEGSHLQAGDEVVIYPAEGCGACPACERGDEQLCPRYAIYGAHRDGALAERMVAPARNCLPKPAALDFDQAASVAVNWVTAWHMLTDRAGVRPGERVLIQAAGSGVSTAGIQIAHFLGARVMATSSTPEKLEHARRLGAEETVNYRQEDVPARVREWTSGRGVDVVFDHVGAPNWIRDIESLAKGGRLVFCGNTGGAEVELNLAPTYFQGLSILGSTMGTRAEMRTVLDLMGQRRFGPVVDRTFSLEEIAEAHRYLEGQKQAGKVVVRVRG